MPRNPQGEKLFISIGYMADNSLKQYYRVDEVAQYFAVSLRTVYRLINAGELKMVRIRDCSRISVEEVRALEKRGIVDLYR